MIAVDAPVLIELLTDGARADAVEAGLRQSLGSGRVVVCDAALAQLCASLRNGADALAAVEEMGVHFSPVEAKSALRAGEMQRRHRQRSGECRPIVIRLPITNEHPCPTSERSPISSVGCSTCRAANEIEHFPSTRTPSPRMIRPWP